jgi:DNA-binding IclR family transcriptional regulator
MVEAPDFKAIEKRYKKDRILLALERRDASHPAELAKLAELDLDETEMLLGELVAEKLVQKLIARYYSLTFDGATRAKELFARKY